MTSTRITVSVRLRERQLQETIICLERADRALYDEAGWVALISALSLFREALIDIQRRIR